MKISLLEAANRVGMTKVGLYKAIKKGVLSANKNELGYWEIDAAELFRVYPPVSGVSGNENAPVSDSKPLDSGGLQQQIDLLRGQLDDLKEQLRQAHADKDRILKMIEEQISTLKLLTDQRSEKPEETPKGFWGRLFG